MRRAQRYSLTLPLMRQAVTTFDSVRHWVDLYQHSSETTVQHSHTHSLLTGAVHVSLIDSTGVIEVSGNSVEDVLYGQGYAHCSERLFQMDYNRHRAAGTLAEYFDAEKLSSDKMSRALDLTGLAQRDLAAQSPSELAMLQAYSAGVNAYLAEHHPLPLEYRAVGITDSDQVPEWKPEHSLAILRLHSTLLGGSSSEAWQAELTRGLVMHKVDADEAAAWGLKSDSSDAHGTAEGVVVLPSASSSIAYVVSGQHTKSGAPISSAVLVSEVRSPSLII